MNVVTVIGTSSKVGTLSHTILSSLITLLGAG